MLASNQKAVSSGPLQRRDTDRNVGLLYDGLGKDDADCALLPFLSPSQADTRTTTVLVDEIDASRLQRAPDYLKCRTPGLARTRF
jgi:hypothetical protein